MPSPIEVRRITEAIPTAIPSRVRKLRRRWALTARKASCRVSAARISMPHQGVDRVEPGGPPGRLDTEEEAGAERRAEGRDNRPVGRIGRKDREELAQNKGAAGAEQVAGQGAEGGKQGRLDQEQVAYARPAGTQRFEQ